MIKIEDLIAFFFSESKICFPGFGTLILDRQEAKRNPVKNKISGPKYTASFQYNEYDENSVSKFLTYHSKKNKTEFIDSDNELRKFSIDILNKLATNDLAPVEGLGTFFKNNEGISFEFSPVLNELLEKSNPDFPLLIMNRQEITVKPPEVPITISKGNNMPISKRKRSLIGPILISLAILSFLCFLICALNIFNTKKPEKTLLQVPAVKESEPLITDTSDAGTADLSIFEDEKVSETSGNKTESGQKTINPENPAKTKMQAGNKNNSGLDALISRSEANRNLYNNTCIIIAGSFQSKGNAKKILERIIRNGFEPYAEVYKGNYRIGTISDMSKISPESQLINVKDRIEKNSWILQPKQD